MATILFDIDRTLFDTDKFLEDMQKTLVLLLGTTHQDFEEVDQAYYDTIDDVIRFDPTAYIEFLSRHFGSSEERLTEKYYNRLKYKHCVFYDVFEATERLSRKHELGIYTEGEEEFQKYKLGTLGLTLFLNPDLIFISPDKTTKSEISKLPKDSYVVDDRERILKILKESGRVNPIWINRENEDKDDEYTTIYTLDDLDKIVK